MKRGVLVAGSHRSRVWGQALLPHDVRDRSHGRLPLVAGRCCQQHAALLLLSTAAQPCNTTQRVRAVCIGPRCDLAGPALVKLKVKYAIASKQAALQAQQPCCSEMGELQDSGMRLIDRMGLMLPGTV